MGLARNPDTDRQAPSNMALQIYRAARQVDHLSDVSLASDLPALRRPRESHRSKWIPTTCVDARQMVRTSEASGNSCARPDLPGRSLKARSRKSEKPRNPCKQPHWACKSFHNRALTYVSTSRSLHGCAAVFQRAKPSMCDNKVKRLGPGARVSYAS